VVRLRRIHATSGLNMQNPSQKWEDLCIFPPLREFQVGIKLWLVPGNYEVSDPRVELMVGTREDIKFLTRIFHELLSRDLEDGRACPPCEQGEAGGPPGNRRVLVPRRT